jgi:replicative DNA helicase
MSDGLILPSAPWSCDAEQSLLGALMLDARGLSDVPTLKAVDFYSPEHTAIFRAVQSLVAQRKPVDVVTVHDALEASGQDCGGMAYLNQLAQSVPSMRGVTRYAEIVREHAARRALLAAAGDALDVARQKGNVGEALDKIATLFAALTHAHVSEAPRHIGEIARERTGYYLDLAEGNVVPGWPTRIPALDRMLNGGLQPGRLYVLAARPAVGKSSFALQICAEQARDERPALFLSQEMSGEEVTDRAVAHAGRLDYGALLSGKMDDEGWHRATDALELLAGLPVYVSDEPALTLGAIKAKARQIRGLQVLVVDYLQLCSASDSTAGSNRNAQVEEISRGLKSLSKEMGIAVIALSQLNRKVEDRAGKRPSLGDLRDSGAIEQDADVILFLWPVREYPDQGRKIVGCGIDKNRQGRTGEFALDFDGARQRWHESTESLQQQPQGKGNSRGFD